MKRPIAFPSIIVLAGAIALAGCGMLVSGAAVAQQKAAPAAAGPSGGALDERVLRLEERILDLQAVIGTLQSFIRDGASVRVQGGAALPGGQAEAPGGGGPSEVSIRVLALETQIRALTGQMAQISERLNQTPSGAGAPPPGPALPPLRQGQQPLAPALASPAPAGPAQPLLPGQPPAPQFGTTTTPAQPAPPLDPVLQSVPVPAPVPRFPPLTGLAGAGEGPRAMYDASYQNFLRSDFAAAENGFRSFISTYPADELTGNAHYWLGRTHFERGQYEPAAKAFLAGYKKNKKSAIAPDSLLHLALSLARLGEKDAACSTLEAISKQFPGAPGKLKQDAAAAIKRGRC